MLGAGNGCNQDGSWYTHRKDSTAIPHTAVECCKWTFCCEQVLSVGCFIIIFNILTQFNLSAWSQAVQDVCGSHKKKPLIAQILLLVLLSTLTAPRSSLVIQRPVWFLVHLSAHPDTQDRQQCLIPTTPTSPPRSPPPPLPSAATSWPQSGTEPALLFGWGDVHTHTHTQPQTRGKRKIEAVWSGLPLWLPTPRLLSFYLLLFLLPCLHGDSLKVPDVTEACYTKLCFGFCFCQGESTFQLSCWIFWE